MKRILCFIMTLAVLAGSLSVNLLAEDSTPECVSDVGDANNDGKVNLSDVALILKHIAKWKDLTLDLEQADVQKDGKVILSDVSMLLKYIAKWTTVRIGHNDTREVIIKATCMNSGETLLTCKVCGSKATVYPGIIPCDYRREVLHEPTCSYDGLYRYSCTMCGGSYTEYVPATGDHKYVEDGRWDPNCIFSGGIQYRCTVCGRYDRKEIAPTGKHTYSYGRCTVCGERQPGTTDTDTAESIRLEVLRLVNVERKKAGLDPLQYYNAGQKAANVRAKEIVNHFSHTRPNGSDCFSALDEAGVSYWSAGENIAYGYATPAEVVEGWMNSPGHRANILEDSFTHLIVGFEGTVGQHGVSWVQLFIGV